jgi:hypothetical protein
MGIIPSSEDKMTISLGNPLKGNYQILQGFGPSSIDYSKFGLIGHSGIDYACPVGTPVYASETGTVTKLQTDKDGYGLHVRLSHYENGKEVGRTIYAHLSEVDCRMGQKVRAGDLIAETGDSGFSTIPHLHFEYRPIPLQSNGYNGAVDPTSYFEDAVTAPETPENPVVLPEKGTAHVSVPFLNIRSMAGITGALYGQFYSGSIIKYDAIITNQGGDVWLQFNGGTLYCAAFYDNAWNVAIN